MEIRRLHFLYLRTVVVVPHKYNYVGDPWQDIGTAVKPVRSRHHAPTLCILRVAWDEEVAIIAMRPCLCCSLLVGYCLPPPLYCCNTPQLLFALQNEALRTTKLLLNYLMSCFFFYTLCFGTIHPGRPSVWSQGCIPPLALALALDFIEIGIGVVTRKSMKGTNRPSLDSCDTFSPYYHSKAWGHSQSNPKNNTRTTAMVGLFIHMFPGTQLFYFFISLSSH